MDVLNNEWKEPTPVFAIVMVLVLLGFVAFTYEPPDQTYAIYNGELLGNEYTCTYGILYKDDAIVTKNGLIIDNQCSSIRLSQEQYLTVRINQNAGD